MEWQRLTTFKLTSSWQFFGDSPTPIFRLKHDSNNAYKYQAVALAALAVQVKDGVEIFSPQKIQPRGELEILQFPTPPAGWRYGFAARQILISNQPIINWSLSVDMPLIPVNPPDIAPSNKSSSFSPSTATVTNTASSVLGANAARKSSTYYNSSAKDTIYLDYFSGVTPTTAAIAIPPGNLYVDDVGWIGGVYAVTKAGTATLNIREFL